MFVVACRCLQTRLVYLHDTLSTIYASASRCDGSFVGAVAHPRIAAFPLVCVCPRPLARRRCGFRAACLKVSEAHRWGAAPARRPSRPCDRRSRCRTSWAPLSSTPSRTMPPPHTIASFHSRCTENRAEAPSTAPEHSSCVACMAALSACLCDASAAAPAVWRETAPETQTAQNSFPLVSACPLPFALPTRARS